MSYIIRKNDKLPFLARASDILSSSLDYHVTLANVAKLVVDNIADFCMIDLLDEEGKMERVAARAGRHSRRTLANRMFEFPADPRNKGAIYDTAKIGRTILVKRVTDKWLRGVARIPEERAVLKKLGIYSLIYAPLKSRERIIGVLTIISSKKDFSYDEDDVLLAEEIAHRAGLAVDHARLYLEAQDAIRKREEFMSIAAHELRTPLTIILLHLQKANADIRKLMSKHTGMDEVIKLLESSEKQGRRLSKLIDDLLDVSLASSGRLTLEKERVDLNVLVEEALELFNIQLKKKRTFVVFDRSKEPIWGVWDRVRLEQVISNLLSNAVKYGSGKPIDVSVRKTANEAEVIVRDKGIGIKPEYRKEIFELFKRGVSSSDYKGLGIGLYVSGKIVEAHAGTIDVESKTGNGSTFTIRLPLK